MRSLTLDLLDACSPSDLSAALPECGPVWKQFRHIGGVHEEYLAAVTAGHINFDGRNRSYRGGASREELRSYFYALSAQHTEVMADAAADLEIEWFRERIPFATHLLRLISHETLHHGQFILLWRTRGVAMPASWQAWGV